MSARDLITEHLSLWTTAVTKKSSSGRGSNGKVELTGIKKLRELILELAVRGLLVEQLNSEKEPTIPSEQRDTQKVGLRNEGRSNGATDGLAIADEEIPFRLPHGWSWKRLEFISEYIQRGKAPKYADSGEVRVISQKCVQWSGFDLRPARFVDDSALGSYHGERYIRANDILWNSTGTGTVGRAVLVYEPSYPMVTDSHVTIVRVREGEAAYILNYISSPSVQRRIEPDHETPLVSGSTKQVELNSGSIKLLPVPIPPLEEQRRIVQKVDELMTLCDRLEQKAGDQIEAHETLVDTLLGTLTRSENATELADNWSRLATHFDTLFTTEQSIEKLKQAILKLAVMGRLVEQEVRDESAEVLLSKLSAARDTLVRKGRLKKGRKLPDVSEEELRFDLPSGWALARLGHVYDIRDGTHDSPKYQQSGVPLITSKNLSSGELCFDDVKLISELDHLKIKDRSDVGRGDILFAMIGSIGNPVIVNTDREFSIKNVALFKYYSNELSDPKYLKIVLEDAAGELKKQAAGGVQSFVSLGKLRHWVIPLPPLEEQDRIVKKVDEVITLCDQLKERLNQVGETRCQLAEAVAEGALN